MNPFSATVLLEMLLEINGVKLVMGFSYRRSDCTNIECVHHRGICLRLFDTCGGKPKSTSQILLCQHLHFGE
ncbi:hypothetical protein RB195_023026 [Necator americanus]|uniref:Secreted protein n=1 Tax=Necator americanus TaxID=51031 RepID=A0ABR1EI42_NECAM